MRKIGLIFSFFSLLGMFLLFSSCSKKTPLTEEQKVYAGKWVAGDNSYIEIFLDGSGNLKTSNVEVNNGAVTFDGNKLKIGTLVRGKTFTINETPIEFRGSLTIRLDGNIYTKR